MKKQTVWNAVDTFDRLYLEGETAPRMMSFGVHLRIIGRPGRFIWFERFLKHVLRYDKVWITTRKNIANHWASHYPFGSKK